VVLPDLDGESGYLPGGTHDASLEEIRARYATNFRRREIFAGLEHVLKLLAARGVKTVWVDGSFITSKARPSDVDLIYVSPSGSDPDTWDWLSQTRRPDLKKYHRVDLWRYPSPQRSKKNTLSRSITIKEFFESDEDDTFKGIIRLIGWNDDQEQ